MLSVDAVCRSNWILPEHGRQDLYVRNLASGVANELITEIGSLHPGDLVPFPFWDDAAWVVSQQTFAQVYCNTTDV